MAVLWKMLLKRNPPPHCLFQLLVPGVPEPVGASLRALTFTLFELLLPGVCLFLFPLDLVLDRGSTLTQNDPHLGPYTHQNHKACFTK